MDRHSLSAVLLAFAGTFFPAKTATLTVQMNRTGVAVSPTLYGAFIEDINRAGDGGLYAEMVQNRLFEDKPHLIAWIPLTNVNAVATFELDRAFTLNSNNPTIVRRQRAPAHLGRPARHNLAGHGVVVPSRNVEKIRTASRPCADAGQNEAGTAPVPGRFIFLRLCAGRRLTLEANHR